MPTAIYWDLSPTDLPRLGLLRYLLFVFYGAYFGPALVGGLLGLPALLANPGLLALVVLLGLVGGPMSLLYLWPMIREPAQRPGPDQLGWIATLEPSGVGLGILVGALAGLVTAATVGSTALYLLVVVGLVVSLPVLGLFDAEGCVDADAGTLTVQERTVGVERLVAVRPYCFGSVTVCRLSYVEGAGGLGRPYLFAVPADVADEVLSVLDSGVAAEADLTPRQSDPLARAVLGGVALLFFAVAAGALLSLQDAGVVVASIVGSLGVLFAIGAYYVA